MHAQLSTRNLNIPNSKLAIKTLNLIGVERQVNFNSIT